VFTNSIKNVEGVRRTKDQEKLRKLHNKKHWDCHDSPNKLMVTLPKGRKMGGVRVKYRGERKEKHRGLRWLNVKRTHHFQKKKLVAERIILKRILKELDEKA
jgi:hypothetical protein